MKVYRHYQQGFLINEYLRDVYKDSLKDEIECLHRIYCRNFFPNKKDYYTTVKNELIKLIDKYNKLYK